VRFQAKVRRKGHKTLSATFREESMAKAWADIQEVRLDGFSLDINLDTLSSITVGDIIKKYADEVAPKHHGYESERFTIQRWLRLPFSRSPVSAFDQSALEMYARWRSSAVTKSTLRREFNILSAVFRNATSIGVRCHELNFRSLTADELIGIYVLSFPNGMKYVGQSVSISSRLYQHEYALRRNRHYNARLQSTANQFGIDAMSVDVFRCSREQLNDEEQRIIELVAPDRLLNHVNAPCTRIKAQS
jgi:hypothetical protein